MIHTYCTVHIASIHILSLRESLARYTFLKNRNPSPRTALSTGAALLNANASSFGFIVLVTDGESTVGDPVAAAEQIRADNTTIIFAVGVGECENTFSSTCFVPCFLEGRDFSTFYMVLDEEATLEAADENGGARSLQMTMKNNSS